MMKAKLTASGKAKLKRIESLPVFGEKIVLGAVKKEMDKLLKEYQKGLDNNDFGLVALQPSTIKSKERKGFQKPTNPLYGKGAEEQKSLYNALRIRKLKNGYKLYVSWAKHWDADLSLRDLFFIHNYGAKIQRGDTIIVIPPRPIFLLTYERVMNKIKSDKRIGSDLKKAIVSYINDANYKYANEYTRRVDQREYEGE